MVDYTTDSLITDIKLKINVPTSQNLYVNTDFVNVLTKELQGRVVPFYMAEREDYFLVSLDIPLIPNQINYSIPVRAIGQKISDLNFLVNPNDLNQQYEYDMALISPGETNIYGYYFKANQLYINRGLPVNGTLRLTYYRRPGYLVKTTEASKITAINFGTNTITLSAPPTTWVVGNLLDFIHTDPPFSPVSDDNEILSILSSDYTFASLPTDLEVGDTVAFQYESPIAQIPVDAYHYLAQCACVRILASTNYTTAYETATAELAIIEKNLRTMLTPRADRDKRKLSNRPFNIWGGYGWRRI